MRKRVSDLITDNEIEKWNTGDIITIKAGTGAGKSFFIKNTLYSVAKKENKKILMLIHRVNCTDQFQNEIEQDEKTNYITIKTYQAIEAIRREGIIFDFEQYDYIVCDEFHYFFEDSLFNSYTDLSLDAILEQEHAIRIFMSATGDNMKTYLTHSNHKNLITIDYELPIEFKFIDKLHFFYRDETLEEFAEQAIKQNEKAIFFVQSAKKAYELHKKFKSVSLFNCSKNNDLYRYVDEKEIDNMLNSEKFNSLILFTTTVMDAGVNIKDKELKHIICDVKDTGVLLQCIGRKRFEGDDNKVHIYIKAQNNNLLGGREVQANKKIEVARYFIEHGEKALIKENYRNLYDNLIYDEITDAGIEKRLNKLMYFKILTDIKELERIKQFSDQHSYCRYMVESIFKNGNFILYESQKEQVMLEEYLESIVGEQLFKENQQKLIDMINVRVNGRQQRSYKKLNEGLEMINLPFVILPKRNSQDRYWEIHKIEN